MRSIEVGSGPSCSPAQYRPPPQPQLQLPIRPEPEPTASSDLRPESPEYQNRWARNHPPDPPDPRRPLVLDLRRPSRPLYYSDLAGPGNPHDAPVFYIPDSIQSLSNESVFDGPEDETETETGNAAGNEAGNEARNEAEEGWLAIASEDFARALERQRQSGRDGSHNVVRSMILQTLHSRSRSQDQDQGYGERTATQPLTATWYQFPADQSLTASPAPAADPGVWDELNQLEHRVSDGLREALYQQPPQSWFRNEAQVQCPDCGHRFQYQHPTEESYQ
ncbi:hypothetical protein BDW71DRAFT_202558 [Aspergillus fruticulosus]